MPLQPNTLQQLEILINKFPDKTFFHKSKKYPISEAQNKPISYSPPFNIVRTPSKKHPDKYHYWVLADQAFAQGKEGCDVYHVTHHLKIDASRKLQESTKQNKRHVAKKVVHNPRYLSPGEIETEKSLTPGHIHIRAPLTKYTGSTPKTRKKHPYPVSYTIMYEMPGESLYDIINGHLFESPLPTNQRLAICSAVLKAWKKQVYDNKLVHRDLKPDNIVVQLTPDVIANIIDFALAKEASQSDYCPAGSPGYVSYESLQGKDTNFQTDLFSLARILGLLFDANEQPFDLNPNSIHRYNFSGLFKYTADLTTQHKDDITSLLRRMSKCEGYKEIQESEIDMVINFFDQILTARQQKIPAAAPPITTPAATISATIASLSVTTPRDQATTPKRTYLAALTQTSTRPATNSPRLSVPPKTSHPATNDPHASEEGEWQQQKRRHRRKR